jgi:hypothetical protein
MNAKYLISVAIAKYPPGTRFLSLHDESSPGHEVIVEEFWHLSGEQIWFSGQVNPLTREQRNGVVYNNGKWAPITLDIKNISEEYKKAKLELIESFTEVKNELQEALENINKQKDGEENNTGDWGYSYS